MAIGTISEITYSRVPWLLSPNNDAQVDTFICQAEWSLQPYLMKPDIDVENEATYSNREKILVGLYSAYNLVTVKVMENTGGKEGAKPTGNKILKKAKADVTEVEFATPSASDGGVLVATAAQILNQLKKEICDLSVTMGISLPLCDVCGDTNPSDVGLNFVFSCGLKNCY